MRGALFMHRSDLTHALVPCEDRLFARIRADGFELVEVPVALIADRQRFSDALQRNGLGYIAQINTCMFEPKGSSKLADHIASFDRLVAQALELRPLLINSHSGRDSWDTETALKFFNHALDVERRTGALILHETHRGRVLYNPWVTRDMCRRLPDLKLTADLSHFCVVAERVFDPASGLDDDWEEILDLVADRTRHIHARVGYAQGPQVGRRAPRPAAPHVRIPIHSTPDRCRIHPPLSTPANCVRTSSGGTASWSGRPRRAVWR